MKDFSRKMGSVAFLAALAVGLGPPLVYRHVTEASAEARAADHAHRLAEDMAEVATRQPRLWRYNAAKVAQVASGWFDRIGASGVAVRDCQGRELYEEGGDDPLLAWAAIRTARGVVGWVGVRADDARERAAMTKLMGGCCALGLILGWALFLLPAAAVKRQATQIADGRAVVRGQEEERARIARDLHDGLGQGLTALRLAVEAGRPEDALAATDEALGELRRVVADLRPPDLDAGGVTEALRAFTERFERRSGLPVSFRCEPKSARWDDASDQVATTLLRILQEALSNAARHAGANELGVLLVDDAGRWLLEVADDGGGMGETVGLRTIRERADFYGGRVEVRQAVEGGSVLRVSLPKDSA